MKLQKIRMEQILYLCETLLTHYISLLTTQERNIIYFVTQNISNKSYSELEELLLPIVKKIWDVELASGNYIVVSWNKKVTPPRRNLITFATISHKDKIIPFCDCVEGVEYKISYEGIIGALWKDGATLIDKNNEYADSEFLIAKLDDINVISYNGSTKLVTPKQLIDLKDENFSYNELILDCRKVEEIGLYKIEQEEFDIDFSKKIY